MSFRLEPPYARLTGLVYLLYFLAAIVAQALVTHGLLAMGHTVNLLAYAFYIALSLLFFGLFKPVNRGLSFFAAFISLVGCTFGIFAIFHHGPAQHGPADVNPLLFFAGYCFLIGFLIVRSRFLPHLIGWLLLMAGIGWYAFLFPLVATHLAVFIEALGIISEAALMFWLLIKGVNQQQWRQQSAFDAPRSPAQFG